MIPNKTAEELQEDVECQCLKSTYHEPHVDTSTVVDGV